MAGKENGATMVEQAQEVVVGVDKSDEVVLQLNMTKGVNLAWDWHNMRKLPEEVVLKLKPANMKAYLVAEATMGNVARVENAKEVKVVLNPFSPLEGDSEFRERIRPRKGWHQSWKNPGRDLEAALAYAYTQVRVPTDKQEKEGFEPGDEAGEVLKRLNTEGKVEAVAVECRQKDYEAYLEWMSQHSRQRYGDVTTTFASNIEQINRGLGKNEGRITPLDGDGKPLA